MSKARQKGTSFENHILTELSAVWPDVERAALKGVNDYGDFINVDGWHIEARNRKTWALPEWIRGVYKKVERKHQHHFKPWMIVFKADKRSVLDENYAVVPLWLVLEMMRRVKRDTLDTTQGY
jgi:hypothetical protein